MARLDFLIKAILLVIMISASVFPVYAPVNDPDVTVEPQITNIGVGSVFEVGIWIRNLPAPMSKLTIVIIFDDTMMELVDAQINDHFGWEQAFSSWGDDQYSGSAFGDPVTEDMEWVTLTFRCLREGTSTVDVEAMITMQTDGTQIEVEADDFDGTVNQFGIVGGYVISVHKAALLAPYLILVGLIVSISTVYIIERRKG